MKSILVTGGAGYIGSHTVHMLAQKGHKIVVLDNLVYGHKQSIIDSEVELVEGDMADEVLLEGLFVQYKFDAVLHFAAYTYVGESVESPMKYYKNNVSGPLVLLDTMIRHDCLKFIFSSTCATYGNPEYVPQWVPQDGKDSCLPITPNGQV